MVDTSFDQDIRAQHGELLRVEDLSVTYGRSGTKRARARGKTTSAVNGVTLHVERGETLALVGESGSGKSSIGRAILRRAPISSGSIMFAGSDIGNLKGASLRALRRKVQMILQDPYGSVNSRLKVRQIVAEPLIVQGVVKSLAEASDAVSELLTRVGLPNDAMDRYPHSFSGGQLQRIGIARALALNPELIIADEPTSALDVSVRGQIVNILRTLQKEFGTAYLFISHDLAVVRHIADRIVVLAGGRVMEAGPVAKIYSAPLHPYTLELLASVPVPDPAVQRDALANSRNLVPTTGSPANGCPFVARCPIRSDRCASEAPPLLDVGSGRQVACWNLPETRELMNDDAMQDIHDMRGR